MSQMPVQPSQSVKVMTKNKNKKILLVIFILMVLIVIGYYIYQNLTKKTSSQESIQEQALTNSSLLSDELVRSEEITSNESTQPQQNLPPVDKELVPDVAKDTVLSLQTNSQTITVGDTLEATVSLSTSVVPDGVEMVISYDPQALTQVQLEPINTFGSFLGQKVDQGQGKIKAVFLRNPQDNPDLSSSLLLLKITGVVAQPGSLSLSFDQVETKVAAAGGQDVLQDLVDLSIVVN